VDPKALLLWLYLLLGGLLALIHVPLLLGKIGPNPWYGFRVKKTLDDPAAWYAANRFAAWRMLVAAGFFMGVAAGTYLLLPRLGLAPYALTCLAALVLGTAVTIVQTIRYLRRL
jgi:hypothetical protein